MQSYVDAYELSEPVVETYRLPQISPRMTIALDVDYDDSDPGSTSDSGAYERAPSSDRWARTRAWASEEML